MAHCFNTKKSEAESERLIRYIKDLKAGVYVLVSSSDDVTKRLTQDAKLLLLQRLGTQLIFKLDYGDPWVYLGVVDDTGRARFKEV